ncbi:Uncharacterized protein family UPF0136 [Macleaya cordata]|uniref:Uncharacterized protein family UPF0136 n=1 Tax=Macleaya cordata TaxID=56857 RepID=A0A200R3K3_MACCD|nr:Uncharacterized protein family UPF0136 [Macleaya cordata]
MSATVQSFVTHINPNRNSLRKRGGFMASSQPPPSFSIQFEALLRPHHSQRISIVARTCSPKGLGTRFLSLDRRRSMNIVPFSASDDDSKHSEIDVEKKKGEVEVGAEESEEAWKQMLESFKEQAIKMQDMSQEAYELYSKKAVVILKETSEKLKIQAHKTSHDLSRLANEISVEGKEYLSTVAEKSPKEVKDIVETFASPPNDLNEMSKVQDFYLGIPYGALLSLGGFLSFMLTGSVSAIRFGVILGGTLLALSISSLRLRKRGESSALALKGQAVIAGIIFLRHLSIFFQRPSLPSCFTTFISGGMVAFYLYRIMLDGDQKKGPRLEHGQDS